MRPILFVFTTVMFSLPALAAQAAPRGVTMGAVLRGTPAWVYVMLAVLLAVGLLSIRSRTVNVWRVVISPAIFIAWGFSPFVFASNPTPDLAIAWLAAASLAGFLATRTAQFTAIQSDRERRLIHLPGSLVPLVRSLVVFTAKYGVGVAGALQLATAGSLALWAFVISGASAGYFIGWLASLVTAYRTAPALESKPDHLNRGAAAGALQ